MDNIIQYTRPKLENHSTTCQKMYFVGSESSKQEHLTNSDIRRQKHAFSRPNPLVENKQMLRRHKKRLLRMIDRSLFLCSMEGFYPSLTRHSMKHFCVFADMKNRRRPKLIVELQSQKTQLFNPETLYLFLPPQRNSPRYAHIYYEFVGGAKKIEYIQHCLMADAIRQ